MFIIVDLECQTEEMEVSVPQSSDIITMIDYSMIDSMNYDLLEAHLLQLSPCVQCKRAMQLHDYMLVLNYMQEKIINTHLKLIIALTQTHSYILPRTHISIVTIHRYKYYQRRLTGKAMVNISTEIQDSQCGGRIAKQLKSWTLVNPHILNKSIIEKLVSLE